MPIRGPVLIIDSDDKSRALMAEYLLACGFSVASVRDVRTAVLNVVLVRPAVIVADLGIPLPGVGSDAPSRLKADPQARRAALIGVTADPRPDTRELAFADGCAAVFTKPLDLAMFKAQVERLCRTR